MFLVVKCNWLCAMDSKHPLLENSEAWLPREVIDVPGLLMLKRDLNNAINNML